MNGPRSDPDAWLRRYGDTERAGPRLFCFPHAGGSAPFFRTWQSASGMAVDLVAIQYPGRQERADEPLLDDLAELAGHTAEAIRPLTDRPYAFFGHSMGAAVAFETAVRLAATGPGPRALFLSGRRAPSRFREPDVHTWSDDRFVEHIVGLQGTEPDLLQDPDLLAAVLPVLRADYRAAETYRPAPGTPRTTAPLVLMAGDEDPEADREAVEAWSAHTIAGAEFLSFPGGHFFLVDRRDDVLAAIGERWDDVAG